MNDDQKKPSRDIWWCLERLFYLIVCLVTFTAPAEAFGETKQKRFSLFGFPRRKGKKNSSRSSSGGDRGEAE